MKRVLFLGEDGPTSAARYLGAILKWAKVPFDYLPDQAPLPKAWLKRDYAAVLLSDYRHDSWTPAAEEWLERRVASGMGLFMIGGWASFTGLVGNYHGSRVETLLPVQCLAKDDRVNHSAVLLTPNECPIVCGYQRAIPRPGTQVIHEFQNIKVTDGRVTRGSRHPALVIGRKGHGRTAAFLSDCAPHWAGSLVDWGATRVTITLDAKVNVEVGSHYLKFFKRWILWAAHK